MSRSEALSIRHLLTSRAHACALANGGRTRSSGATAFRGQITHIGQVDDRSTPVKDPADDAIGSPVAGILRLMNDEKVEARDR